MDNALKQRLVGASVLVALAVVILPMLLGGGAESPQEAEPIEIPQRPAEISFETRRFPVGEQPADQPSELPDREIPELGSGEPESAAGQQESLQARLERVAAESEASRVTSESASEPQAPTPAEVVEDSGVPDGESIPPEIAGASSASGDSSPLDEQVAVEPDPLPVEPEPVQAEPVPPEPAAPIGETGSPSGRYVVQVASFSSTANADRLAGTLREGGMPVLMDTVDSAAGVLHRVRVGPFEQRAEADQVLARLGQQVPDVRPRLVDLRPDEEAPVTQPSDPLVRWSVQVGVFSESANAEKLVFQLRDAGFRAQSQREQSGGRDVYRVLVGPEVSRDDALRTRDRIEAEQGIKGIVQSTD